MTDWYTLAPEVHDIILSFFCQDIIYEYSSFDPKDLWQVVDVDVLLRVRPIWPEAPEPLRNFLSALLTCRSFYHTLRRLKFNDYQSPHQSATETLQIIQIRKCRLIVEHANNDPEWPSLIWVAAFMGLAGIFWKNPLAGLNYDTILSVMRVLENDSILMLIPHLEELVLQYTYPTSSDEFSYTHRYLVRWPRIPLVLFQLGSRVGSGPNYSVCSVTGLYEGSSYQELIAMPLRRRTRRGHAIVQQSENRKIIEACPVLRELGRASGEWWLFTPGMPVSANWWFLVNYREKLIWGNMCEPKLCVWDDVWEPSSWKVEEHKTFDQDWIIYE